MRLALKTWTYEVNYKKKALWCTNNWYNYSDSSMWNSSFVYCRCLPTLLKKSHWLEKLSTPYKVWMEQRWGAGGLAAGCILINILKIPTMSFLMLRYLRVFYKYSQNMGSSQLLMAVVIINARHPVSVRNKCSFCSKVFTIWTEIWHCEWKW